MGKEELEAVIDKWGEKAESRASDFEKAYIGSVCTLAKSPEILDLMRQKYEETRISASINYERTTRIFEEILDVILDVYKKRNEIPCNVLRESVKISLERISKPKITDFLCLRFGADMKENIGKILIEK